MSLLNYDDNNATFEEIVKLALTNNESFDTEKYKSRIAVEEQGKIRSSERVSNQVQFEYYDVTEKTTYLITYTEITDDIGAKYITETVSPIK